MPAEIHEKLQEVPLEALIESPELEAWEKHASEGCSACARALVNARELTSRLATSEVAAPNSELRGRLLASARAVRAPSEEASERARIPDASAVVAHRHLLGEDEPARIAEIDALHALEESASDPAHRLLAELAPYIELPVLFVNLVRGDRVAYRVQRGLPDAFAAIRELRREMSYCTHCLSTNAPLVVEDARDEAFFRGSPMVTRFHCVAYLGVPLTTSRGLSVGTLCALGFEPHRHRPGEVALFEHYAPVLAEVLEAPRGAPSKVREAGAGLYARPWFEALLALVAPLDPGAALLSVRGAPVEVIAGAAVAGEIAGRLATGDVGLLAPGDAEMVIARLAAAGLSATRLPLA